MIQNTAVEHPVHVPNAVSSELKQCFFFSFFLKSSYLLRVNYFKDLKAIRNHAFYEEVSGGVVIIPHYATFNFIYILFQIAGVS